MSQKLSKLYVDRYLDVFVMVILIISLAMYRYVGCKWALEDIKKFIALLFHFSSLKSLSCWAIFPGTDKFIQFFFYFNDSTKNVCTSVLF